MTDLAAVNAFTEFNGLSWTKWPTFSQKLIDEFRKVTTITFLILKLYNASLMSPQRKESDVTTSQDDETTTSLGFAEAMPKREVPSFFSSYNWGAYGSERIVDTLCFVKLVNQLQDTDRKQRKMPMHFAELSDHFRCFVKNCILLYDLDCFLESQTIVLTHRSRIMFQALGNLQQKSENRQHRWQRSEHII